MKSKEVAEFSLVAMGIKYLSSAAATDVATIIAIFGTDLRA